MQAVACGSEKNSCCNDEDGRLKKKGRWFISVPFFIRGYIVEAGRQGNDIPFRRPDNFVRYRIRG